MPEPTHGKSPTPTLWRPPSDKLELKAGVWVAGSTTPVSYPADANDLCLQVEENSYWFRHRMDCIQVVIRLFPPAGLLYDIGGGNGFVASTLQTAGMEVALVEPGKGAHNALRRGIRHIVQATLADAGFRPHSLPSVGAFDVVEHIADDVAFLRVIREKLTPGGRFYCTVPANHALWSDEDIHAGHFRRYSRLTLSSTLYRAGFQIEFISPIFAWLAAPVYLCRALPFRLGLRKRPTRDTLAAMQADHRLPPALSPLISRLHAWEHSRLRERYPLPFGTSLLCVARVDESWSSPTAP